MGRCGKVVARVYRHPCWGSLGCQSSLLWAQVPSAPQPFCCILPRAAGKGCANLASQRSPQSLNHTSQSKSGHGAIQEQLSGLKGLMQSRQLRQTSSGPPASLKRDNTNHAFCYKELVFLAELWLVKLTRVNEIIVSSMLGLPLQASTPWVGSAFPTSVLPETSKDTALLLLHWLHFAQALG